MTLRDWSTLYLLQPEIFQPSHRLHPLAAVPRSIGEPGYRELWRLTDYRVSTVQAGTVWLRPRPTFYDAYPDGMTHLDDHAPADEDRPF